MQSIINGFRYLFPFILALTCCGLSYKYSISYNYKNFEKVLDGVITFGSIVVGFLGALLGILVSVRNSGIVKEIFESNNKTVLKIYFNETFIVGFLTIITSISLYILKEYDQVASKIVFYFWILFVIWFIPSTYRIINILMTVLFKSNVRDNSLRPEGNAVDNHEDREDMKERLKRNN
ncbi:hypothetical protein GLW00_12795 [Halobacillus litoralis]|uniref:Uncharacterized protein n=1 Tax=Halobacillus litoralis TaxID=45668 RepID=A0A845FDW3_9BACI|nr:hypothetical protein [Halobacillus litoralis]MYL71737.1 hypothetical protein [Halobacillus litoralis]